MPQGGFVKVRYPIRYSENTPPPPRRFGHIPRWKDVTDRLEELRDRGGVLNIAVPPAKVKDEIKSLRNAIFRARKKRGIRSYYSCAVTDDGITVWCRVVDPPEPDEEE